MMTSLYIGYVNLTKKSKKSYFSWLWIDKHPKDPYSIIRVASIRPKVLFYRLQDTISAIKQAFGIAKAATNASASLRISPHNSSTNRRIALDFAPVM